MDRPILKSKNYLEFKHTIRTTGSTSYAISGNSYDAGENAPDSMLPTPAFRRVQRPKKPRPVSVEAPRSVHMQ
jgi:hypothetical protein